MGKSSSFKRIKKDLEKIRKGLNCIEYKIEEKSRQMKKEPLDFLGTPIKIGDRAIRAHVQGHFQQFKKVEITGIEEITNGRNPNVFQPFKIKIMTDGNIRESWTYPDRLIVHRNFKTPI